MVSTDSIQITDTGKRRTSSVSAEETDKANSGSAINLNGVEITLDESSVLNTNTSLNKKGGDALMFSIGEVDHIGIEKPKWVIRGELDFTSATDKAKIKMLRDLVRTKGYKTLSGDLPDWLDGSDNSSTVNVRVESVRLIHNVGRSVISYQMSLIETE